MTHWWQWPTSQRHARGMWHMTLLNWVGVFLVSTLAVAQDNEDPRRLALNQFHRTPPFLVRVDVDRPDRIYRSGDTIQISVRSEREGYLYLFYCDANQDVTCLFPNRVQSDNNIPANRTIVIPDESSGFRLRVGQPFGDEVLKAVVTTQPLQTLELETLTKGNFTTLEPRKLKAVFVEVGVDDGSVNSLTPGTQPGSVATARQWSEHHVQVTTTGQAAAAPPRLNLESTGLENAVTGTQQPRVEPSTETPAAAANAGRPKRVGVFIGISEYHDQGISPLSVAHVDAETLATVMKEQSQLDEVVVLVNEQATLSQIQAIIQQRLPAATRPGDLVIIYWSGHGGRTSNLDGTEPDGFDEYLVPYDGRLEPAAAIRTTMLLDKTFGRWVQNLDGRKLIVIIDACHSGGQTQGAIKALSGGDSVLPFRKFFFATTLRRTKDIGQRETAVLASSRATQVSFERREHDLSVMTHFLVQKLSSGHGPVTLQETAEFLVEQVPAFVTEHYPGTTQTPIFVDQTTPPVFLRE